MQVERTAKTENAPDLDFDNTVYESSKALCVQRNGSQPRRKVGSVPVRPSLA